MSHSCTGGFGALVAANHCRLSWIGVEPCHHYYSRLEPVQRRLTHYAVTQDTKHYHYKDENAEAREWITKEIGLKLNVPPKEPDSVRPSDYYIAVKRVSPESTPQPLLMPRAYYTLCETTGLR